MDTTNVGATPTLAVLPSDGAQIRGLFMASVEQRLATFLAGEYDRWKGVDEVTVLLDALGALIDAGGKRLRPLFCVTGYLAAGGAVLDQRVVAAAAALEMVHASALIHDDVIDASSTRRGQPTVHVRHAAEHERHGWRGEARRYGEGVAILVGDLALMYCDQLMWDAFPVVADTWSTLRTELVMGQYIDVNAAARGTADPELCRYVAVTKSGRYTIQRPLELGARIAGRPELAPVFDAYGTAIGEAFQLRDDLLDVFGDGGATGKPHGLDLEQHKMTLLLVFAMERDPRIAALVEGGCDDSGLLRNLLEEAKIDAAVEDHIEMLVERGCAALHAADIDVEWRTELTELAQMVAFRDR